MLLKFIDQKIRQAFSNSAMQYEMFASLQKEIGRELTRKLTKKENVRHILDVGMGTGWLSYRLHLLFPEAKVIGLDFADGMVEWAKGKYEGFKIIQADARSLPFKENTFDIVISNLAYQWVVDLPSAFNGAYFSLKEDGNFCVTLFGYDTLRELFESLESTRDKAGQEFPIKRLAGEETIYAALKEAGFQNVQLDSEIIQLHFADMWELVQLLKKIGANVISKDIYVGRDWLSRADDYYQQQFKDRWGVYASFEVIWIEASK